MTYIPEAEQIQYIITEAEVAYIIKALDVAWIHMDSHGDPSLREEHTRTWESMGILHNLKSEDSGKQYWGDHPSPLGGGLSEGNEFSYETRVRKSNSAIHTARAIDQVIDSKVFTDTDYFD